MRFYQRDMTFSEVNNVTFCLNRIYRIAEEVCAWTGDDWTMLKAEPHKLVLDRVASRRIGGVVIDFMGWGGQGRDGRLEIEFVSASFAFEGTRDGEGKRPRTTKLVWTTVGSRRVIAEDLLFKLVLHDIRRGALGKHCSLILPKLYPRSVDAAYTALSIENRRLRRQLEELLEEHQVGAGPS